MTLEDENVTILLISSSKLLKNKFIESLNNNRNNFSLMNKTVDSLKSAEEKYVLSCVVSNYSIHPEVTESNSGSETENHYVQIIDVNDKSLIQSLISSSFNERNFPYKINGVIYLFDESTSDTFAYVSTLQYELSKSFTSYFKKLKILLCNMINATVIGPRDEHRNDESASIIRRLDGLIEDFSNLQYTTQDFEETIYGTKIRMQNRNDNKLLANFDDLIRRIVTSKHLKDSKEAKVDKNENSVTTANIDSSSNSIRSSNVNLNNEKNTKLANFKKNYQGEMVNNLRNGTFRKGLYLIN